MLEILNQTLSPAVMQQQAALRAAAAKAEAYYLEEAKKEDAASVEVFRNAGVEIDGDVRREYLAMVDED